MYTDAIVRTCTYVCTVMSVASLSLPNKVLTWPSSEGLEVKQE